MNLLIEIFIVSFFLNLLYELIHSLLYKTCINAPLPKYVYLMLKGGIFDGFAISITYFITYIIFKNISPLESYLQLSLFVVISVISAYAWEIYSVSNKRWEYSKKMPVILGAGLTPLFQLAITGLLAFYWIF